MIDIPEKLEEIDKKINEIIMNDLVIFMCPPCSVYKESPKDQQIVS